MTCAIMCEIDNTQYNLSHMSKADTIILRLDGQGHHSSTG
jgi:hypothetical protein